MRRNALGRPQLASRSGVWSAFARYEITIGHSDWPKYWAKISPNRSMASANRVGLIAAAP